MTFITIKKLFGFVGNRIAKDTTASHDRLYADNKTGGEASSSSTVYLLAAAQHLVSAARVQLKSFWDDLYYRESGTIPSGLQIIPVRIPVQAIAHPNNNFGGLTMRTGDVAQPGLN